MFLSAGKSINTPLWFTLVGGVPVNYCTIWFEEAMSSTSTVTFFSSTLTECQLHGQLSRTEQSTDAQQERVMWLFLQKVERCRKKCFVSTRVVRKCYQWKLDFKSHSDWYRLVKRNFWVLLGPRGWLYMHNVYNFLFAIMHQIHYFSFRIHKYEWNKLN